MSERPLDVLHNALVVEIAEFYVRTGLCLDVVRVDWMPHVKGDKSPKLIRDIRVEVSG